MDVQLSSMVNQADLLRAFAQKEAYTSLRIDMRFNPDHPCLGIAFSSSRGGFFSPLYSLAYISNHTTEGTFNPPNRPAVKGYLRVELYNGAVRFSVSSAKFRSSESAIFWDDGNYFIGAAPLFLAICEHLLSSDEVNFFSSSERRLVSEWNRVSQYLTRVNVCELFKLVSQIADGRLPKDHPLMACPDVKHGLLREIYGYDETNDRIPVSLRTYPELKYTTA